MSKRGGPTEDLLFSGKFQGGREYFLKAIRRIIAIANQPANDGPYHWPMFVDQV
jgi:hypothetical protein